MFFNFFVFSMLFATFGQKFLFFRFHSSRWTINQKKFDPNLIKIKKKQLKKTLKKYAYIVVLNFVILNDNLH